MATIHSFPVHQTRSYMTNTSILSYFNHFGFRTKMSRLFTWFIRLQIVYFVLLFISVGFRFFPQIAAPDDKEPLTFIINDSVVVYTKLQSTFARRCFLSLTVPVNINNYINMTRINLILCCINLGLVIWIQHIIYHVPSKYLQNSYRWFCWGRKILIIFVISNIFSQIISSTACRSIEILYDSRYMSMIIVQLFDPIMCICFSFFLGIKFASIRLRTKMRRLFTWYLQIQFVYVLIFISCIAFCIWLQLVDIRTENTGELALSKMNQSSVSYTSYEFALATRCLLSPTSNFIDNISSYTYMSNINHTICFISLFLIYLVQSFFNNVSSKYLENPYHWFCCGRRILVIFVGFSILNQMVTASACRPIEIFYDLQHMWMFILQLFSFLNCIGFAFFLGVKYVSVRPEHRLSAYE